jgi:hypothetical protein
MSSLRIGERGVPTQNGLQIAPKNSSLEQKLLSEQWLLSNGLITETSADNLLGYAYMQPGVESAKITIDPDDANEEYP